jgi:signal peptidase I
VSSNGGSKGKGERDGKTHVPNGRANDNQQKPAGKSGPEENLWTRFLSWRREARRKARVRREEKGPLRDWIETIISVILIVFVIRVTAVEAYRIPTGSMENTLLVGDFLLVDKFSYGIRTPDWIGIPYTSLGFRVPYTRLPGPAEPKQGDVIVFRYPLDQRVNYIKRCVAVGGQTVEIRDKVVYVDGEVVPLPPLGKYTDPYILPPHINMRHIVPRGAGNKDNYGPVTVPEGHLFMMGDNRDNSADSRYWGFLDKRLVLGKAALIYFSWDRHAPLHRFWNKVRWSRLLSTIH